jgi:hypothetical protein
MAPILTETCWSPLAGSPQVPRMVDIQAGSEQVRRPLDVKVLATPGEGGDDLQAGAEATFAWQDELLDELG